MPSVTDYQKIRDYLRERRFIDTKQNAFVMIGPDGTQVDILPFGDIEIDGRVELAGEGMTSIRVNGFKEVHQLGTATIQLDEEHEFHAATLPAIVLLKLISFNDRPEMRTKDAGDIASIILHYFELEANTVYDKGGDLFIDNIERSSEQFAAIVIGRQLRVICNSNTTLRERLVSIVSGEIQAGEKSAFIREMVRVSGKTVEEMLRWLSGLVEVINYQARS